MAKPVALFATAALCIACLTARGQGTPPGPGLAPSASEPSRGKQTRREVARLYILQRMRESLSLSDAQTLKAMDLLAAIDAERQTNMEDVRDLMTSFEKQLADPTTPEERLKESVAEFQRGQTKHESAMRDLETKLLAIMTPKQQVQFLVLRRQIMEEVREDVPPRVRANRQRSLP